METLDTVIQNVDISNISKVFGLDANSFLILIIGSFIVGYICLTFYYKIYYNQDNKNWTDLEFSEKAIVSLFIGFLSIMVSSFGVATYEFIGRYINRDYNNLSQFFSQLYYIVPFLYFTFISFLTHKDEYRGLDFIKKYIYYSMLGIIILAFLFLYIILFSIRNWNAMLLFFSFCSSIFHYIFFP